jgi:uncharacterized membrane protein YbhN (UPF0104 family)
MIGAHHSQQGSRRWLPAVLRWIAGLAVLGVLLYFLPFATVRKAIAQIPAWLFLGALAGYLLAHTLGIAKWRMVVNAAGAQLDFATSAQCYLGGLFGTLFLPSIVGGDVIRLAVGLRRSPRPAAVLAGNVLDRFLDVAAQLPGSMPENLRHTTRKVLLVCAAGVVVLVALTILSRRALLAGRSVRFRRRLARLRHALRSISRQPSKLLLGWLVGTLIQSTFLILTVRLAVACGLVLPLRLWLFAWPLAKLAAVLPLTQGGIGVREAALVALLTPFGAPGHLVLAAGLVWESVIIAGGLLSGGAAFLLRRAASSRPGT